MQERQTVRHVVSRWLKKDKVNSEYLRFYVSDRTAPGTLEWPVLLDEVIPEGWSVVVKLPRSVE